MRNVLYWFHVTNIWRLPATFDNLGLSFLDLVQKAKRAKKKLLKREGDDRTDSGSQERYESFSYGGVDPYMWEPQEVGRRARKRYALGIAFLLILIGKVLQYCWSCMELCLYCVWFTVAWGYGLHIDFVQSAYIVWCDGENADNWGGGGGGNRESVPQLTLWAG